MFQWSNLALAKARFFLLVDLREFFSDLGSGDDWSFSELFFFFLLISPEKKI